MVENKIGTLNDQLHVHFGLLVFLTCAVLLRRRRHRTILAWTIVALPQATNEAFDARDWISWTQTVNWSETTKDAVLADCPFVDLALGQGMTSQMLGVTIDAGWIRA